MKGKLNSNCKRMVVKFGLV